MNEDGRISDRGRIHEQDQRHDDQSDVSVEYDVLQHVVSPCWIVVCDLVRCDRRLLGGEVM